MEMHAANIPAQLAQLDAQGLEKAPTFIKVLTQSGVSALTDITLPPSERREQVRQTFLDSFATQSIARIVLGRYWFGASAEDKLRFVDVLGYYVADNVTDNFPQGRFEIFDTAKIDGPNPAVPRYEVVTVLVADTFSSRIIWTIDVIDDQPKVFDLKIDGSSFLQSQKDKFALILQRNNGSIPDLIESIQPHD